MNIRAPKKLIEVALPLDDINVACTREKSIRHGHPSTLHLWWARRPLAAARAVLFAQMVNDPGGERGWDSSKGITKAKAQAERERLFNIIRRLVQWENTSNEEVLEEARQEIWRSWRETCEMNKGNPLFDPEKLPAFHDPFAGGGALPLEAQRLGLDSYASDLNPVAVLINKAMIEIPPKFAGNPPVNPEYQKSGKEKKLLSQWKGARGLAEDVHYYGQWMRDEAQKRIGHLYPPIEVTAAMASTRPDLKKHIGKKLTVIAWLWARTVKSPNPAYSNVDVPLASTFMLSTKAGKEAYIKPVIEGSSYRFTVKMGQPKEGDDAKNGTKLARANFVCLMSGAPISGDYIKAEGNAGRMGVRLMAIVAEGTRERVYIAPTPEHEIVAHKVKPKWKPEMTISGSTQYLGTKPYGMTRFDQLFTDRQLLALTTFSDLVQKASMEVKHAAVRFGLLDDDKSLDNGGTGASAYADAVAMYLALGVDRLADRSSTICGWDSGYTKIRNTFGRQAIPMTWDYAEGNAFSDSTGNFSALLEWVEKYLMQAPAMPSGHCIQKDASTQDISINKIVSTDPPYYDNVPYADLSDYFYIWLRSSLKFVFPDMFSTLAVPKAEELVAFAYRHQNGKAGAETFFLNGMTQAMHRIVENAHPAFPVTIYYAFKQAESDDNTGTSSTGWETFLDAVIRAGFAISGTWPMRTELSNRMRGTGSNALASSIILVCRQRPIDAVSISRKQFMRELKDALPEALEDMIGGKEGQTPIAPVDLAQSALGPGMALFSKYSAILEADGSAMPVREALIQINKMVDEYFNAAEGDLDSDSRFCLEWFKQHGFKQGAFGEADVLARAKGTSVDTVKEAGVIESGAGKVRLLKTEEYPVDWDPLKDNRTPVWEALHHLVRLLWKEGESGAGAVFAKIPQRTENIRQLAYRLYTLCERQGWAEEARAYNELIASWHAIVDAAQKAGTQGEQLKLDM